VIPLGIPVASTGHARGAAFLALKKVVVGNY